MSPSIRLVHILLDQMTYDWNFGDCCLNRWESPPNPLVHDVPTVQFLFNHVLILGAQNGRLDTKFYTKHDSEAVLPGKLTCPLKMNGCFRCISYWKVVPNLGDIPSFSGVSFWAISFIPLAAVGCSDCCGCCWLGSLVTWKRRWSWHGVFVAMVKTRFRVKICQSKYWVINCHSFWLMTPVIITIMFLIWWYDHCRFWSWLDANIWWCCCGDAITTCCWSFGESRIPR